MLKFIGFSNNHHPSGVKLLEKNIRRGIWVILTWNSGYTPINGAFLEHNIAGVTLTINKKTKLLYISILIAGLISLFITLATPSEAKSGFWMGYSRERLILFGVQVLLYLFSVLLFVFIAKWFQSPFVKKLNGFLHDPAYYFMLRNLLLGLAIFSSVVFFYGGIIVPQALLGLSFWFTYNGWAGYLFFKRTFTKPVASLINPEPSVSVSRDQGARQKKLISLVLILLGAVYFLAFIPTNLKGTATAQEFYNSGGDEYVMYPVVVKMLSSQSTLRLNFYRFFNYGDYIYGFPFYGLSALLLLPLKLIFGGGFADQIQINLLILRQLVSVLPMVLSAYLFTYLGSRFKHWWTSIPMFFLILTIPAVINYNIRFWHPDSLNLLFIGLTIFFLDRDGFRFGRDFYFAAIVCGLSVATRLYGLFFFLAIAGLLVAAIVKKTLTVRKALLHGLIFCLLMGGTILAASPYLFNPGEYVSLQRLSGKKQVDLFQGYNEPDPQGVYKTGLKAWLPFMTRGNGSVVTPGILILSILVGLFGRYRKHYYWVLFSWLLVLGSFLIFFVLVKSIHYLLPFFIPLYTAALAIPDNLDEFMGRIQMSHSLQIGSRILIFTILAGIGIYQFWINIQWITAQHLFI